MIMIMIMSMIMIMIMFSLLLMERRFFLRFEKRRENFSNLIYCL